ncbi:hypothetical protein [Parafrankia sp. EAN1pec]|uniref:hypothetical protein n=1 Tax=Parafrankia sp. (strain EAN1pec) TaxID=298653 RepID=UPI003219FBF1
MLAVGAGVLVASAGVAGAQTAVPAAPSATTPAPAGAPAQRVEPAAPRPQVPPVVPAPSGGDAPAPSGGPSPEGSEEAPAPGEVPPPPSAEPAPTAPGSESDGGGGGVVGALFGWADIPGRILRAINGWFEGLVEAALEPVVRLLGQTILSTPDVTEQPRIRELWAGSVLIANSVMLLVLMAGGVAAMGYDSVQTRATAKEMLPRMILGFGEANLSLPLIGWSIDAANALSRAFTNMSGLDASGAFSVLLTVLAAGRIHGIFFVLLLIGVVGMIVMLLVGWVIRVIVLMGLAVAGPLMLICRGLPWTEHIANLYWRATAGCLAVQVGQSVLLVLGVRVLFASDDGAFHPVGVADSLGNILTAAGLFYVAIRLQSTVMRTVMGGGRSTVVSLVKYRLLRKGLQHLGIPL